MLIQSIENLEEVYQMKWEIFQIKIFCDRGLNLHRCCFC